MPTAAKLFSAVAFALVAFVATQLYANSMPAGRTPGALREIATMIGLICGWWIMGSFASRPHGRIEAMATGVRTSFTIVVLVLITFATVEMLEQSMSGRYDGPMEAFLSIFDLALKMGNRMVTPEIISVLLLGGLFGGAVGHWAGRTWR